MCKKCKKGKSSKYAQIIDASFKNALSLIQNVKWIKLNGEVDIEVLQSQIQDLKKEMDDLRTKQMFEELPKKEEEDEWLKKQAERRKKQIEAEYATILPMVEGLVYKMMANIFEKVKEFQTIEAEMLKHA